MKKIVILICLCMSILYVFPKNVNAIASFKIVINNNVEGYIGETIPCQIVELTFSDPTQYFFNTDVINIDDDITSWFTNIPSGCNYSAKVQSVSQTQINVSFNGTIVSETGESETPIEITIPYISDDEETKDVNEEKYYVLQNSNPYISSISEVDNTNAYYIIEKHPFEIAYKGPYTISGIVGQELQAQIVEVEIISCGPDNEEFDLNIENLQLPIINGLTPTVTYLNPNGLEITITYTGVPLEASHDLIHTTIPKENMLSKIEDRIVPDRIDVKFDINPIVSNKTDSEDTIQFIPPNTGIE